MQIDSVQWKPAVPSRGIDPKKAYNAVEKIRANNDGDLTDEAIVSAAKPKNHILHKWFEWDDQKAADAMRRTQARLLIRSFSVTYKEAPESPVRAYEVHQKARAGGNSRTAYRTVEDVLNDPVSRDQLIATAIRQAMEFRRRFKHIHELSRIVEAIDQTVEEVGSAEV